MKKDSFDLGRGEDEIEKMSIIYSFYSTVVHLINKLAIAYPLPPLFSFLRRLVLTLVHL